MDASKEVRVENLLIRMSLAVGKEKVGGRLEFVTLRW